MRRRRAGASRSLSFVDRGRQRYPAAAAAAAAASSSASSPPPPPSSLGSNYSARLSAVAQAEVSRTKSK